MVTELGMKNNMIMKEYKSITIKIDLKSRLDDQLNDYAKKGWHITHVVTKNINPDNGCGEFIYLLERNVKRRKAAFGSLGYDAIKVKIALLKLGDALGGPIKKGFIHIKW